MATDEEKSKIVKLLEGLDVPEVKISKRCLGLVKEFHDKYNDELHMENMENEPYDNPYIPDKELLQENEKKLKALLEESKRAKMEMKVDSILPTISDPKRPWRTHSNKEKLLRIDIELKQHIEKSGIAISPMEEDEMKHLIKECRKETQIAPRVGAERLRDTVDEARRSLPNFQYRTIENSTATAILPEAHGTVTLINPVEYTEYKKCIGSGQHIPRPETRQCFLRSLGELQQLRILALEYAHIADGTGNALLSLLPVIRRPHFQLQLICREDQTPGKADVRLGVGGYDIPDTAWRRVTTSCPDLYLFMAFFRIRDYDNVRRFLTPSVPLREAHLQLGVDLTVTQRQDSDLSCFMRTLAYYNADSLGDLMLGLLSNVIPLLPSDAEYSPMAFSRTAPPACARADAPADLFYVHRPLFRTRPARSIHNSGVRGVREHTSLREVFKYYRNNRTVKNYFILCAELKQIDIQLQDEDSKRIYWSRTVEVLTEQYKEIMQLFDIKFSLEIYKC